MVKDIQNKTDLTRTTILKIILESCRINELLINPQLFLDLVTNEIKKVLDDLMINGIKYEKINGKIYEMKLFEDQEIEGYKQSLYKVIDQEKTLYNYIEFDSDIEKKFATDCDANENIEFYIKLPNWFKINTPIGTYNPDWALIYKNENKIYFVAETKGNSNDLELRKKEEIKIECGKAHFKEFDDVEFKKIKNLSDLIN